MVLLLPDPAPTLAGPAVENIAATGLGNPVTAVLMAYRAIDTLLEVVVLLLALDRRLVIWRRTVPGAACPACAPFPTRMAR